MLGEETVYRVKDGLLIVPLGLVAGNPGHAQLVQYGGDVLMLEFDRAVGAANPGH